MHAHCMGAAEPPHADLNPCMPVATHSGVCAQIPGVPVMYLQAHRYTVERLPEATLGGAPRT